MGKPTGEAEVTARRATMNRLDTAIERAEAGGRDALPDEELQHFERLSKLLAARRVIEGDRRRDPGPFIGLVVTLAVVILFLHSTRVANTEVEASIVLSSAEFHATEAGELAPTRRPGRLVFAGSGGIELSDTADQTHEFPLKAAPLSITAADGGHLAAQHVKYGKGGTVRLSLTSARQLVMHTTGASAEFQGVVFGPVHVAAEGVDEDRTYEPPGTSIAGSSESEFDVCMDLPKSRECVVCDPVRVSEVRCLAHRPGEVTDDTMPPSAVLSGTVHFLEVPLDYELQHGERLHIKLDGASKLDSFVRQITVNPETEAFQVSLHAWVSELRAGSDSTANDLMPTRLEYLRARRGPELMWGTLLSLLAVLGTVAQWFRGERS